MILKTKNIVKQFVNHRALDRVGISVPEQSIFGLLGPNGAGKTTLIRIINQITAPDSGQVFFKGNPLVRDDVNDIGYLPEERGLYKKMKVGEQAIYLAQLKGITKTDARKKLRYWFEKFDMTGWWNKKVEELSKGMQQKVQFITTIIHEPPLLIFDEPFSGFDPINTNLLKREILKLRDNGTTVIFSTHNMSSVEEICDDIVLINKAKKILEGKVAQLRKDFKENHFVVEYSGNFNEKSLKNKDIEVDTHEKNGTTGKISIKVSHKDPQMLILSEMMKQVTILSFNEKLPSMNDIFIKAVEQDKN